MWNEQCQEAFEKIKNHLMKPPILVPLVSEKPLLLYLTTTNIAMEALLAQYIEEIRKENAIYYISKKMLPYENKYLPFKKTCSTCMGNPQTQTLCACSQGFVDCKNGSFEVLNGKTGARWKNC